MKQGLAKLVFIVDRSGSMSSIASDMEGAIQEVLKEQKETHDGEMLVTFVRFDDQYEEVFSDKPIADVTDTAISPRNMTALLDAIGKTVNNVSEKFEAADEDERPERVLFIIVTDGQENASKEFTRDQVFKLIEEKKTQNRWGFTFIGANQDAIQEGGYLGVNMADAINFRASAKGVKGMSRAISTYTTSYMAQGDASYTDQDRLAAMDEDE